MEFHKFCIIKLVLALELPFLGTASTVRPVEVCELVSARRDFYSRISLNSPNFIARYPGIEMNIRDAYSFICHNYNFRQREDEIFLIGFSRGAFTVRCVAALIEDVGLLTKRGLVHLKEVYGLWKEKCPDDRSVFKSNARIADLQKEGSIVGNVKVKACAVWDTVSALGVPLPMATLQYKKLLGFVNRRVCSNIEFAFQALALSEKR